MSVAGPAPCAPRQDDLEQPLRALKAVAAASANPHLVKAMSSTRSLRNVETRKKKAKRAIPRTTKTRIQGNTAAARKRLKKLSGLKRGAKTAAKA